MEFGTNIDEKTQKVNYGYLTFNSGKKILLDVGEVKEFEDQLRLARAGGKEKERNRLVGTTLPILKEILDWYRAAPTEEIEAVETAIEWDFPYTKILNNIHRLSNQDPGDILKESDERNKRIGKNPDK